MGVVASGASSGARASASRSGGAATPAEAAPNLDQRLLHGDNGLANADLPVAQLHHQHPSEKIISKYNWAPVRAIKS